jgi:flagellar basal-body rod protein FlgG
MFQVLMPDGSTGFTRNGQFQVNSNGEVVTANGYPLQPSITVPSNASIVTIGSDGIVTASIAGEENAVSQLGQIDLADFVNPQGLKAIGNNLFRETEASGNPVVGTPGLAGLGNVSQGTLETSNVDVVEEMVNMITTQRAYEMNSKVVSSADQMLQFITQNL